MNFLNRLRIIKRATADNALISALQFVHVYDGRMQSTDGKIVVDVACPELKDMTFSVAGTKFVKAVEACGDLPEKMTLTESSLTVQTGKFKAKLPLFDGTFPKREFAYTQDQLINVPVRFHELLRDILPFVGVDASRPWCCGVLFKDGNAYATNNTTVVKGESHFSKDVMPFNLPSFAITEMLGFAESPKYCYVDENAVTFDYGHFLFKTQLLSSEWPDLSKMLPDESEKYPAIPSGLKDAVEKVMAFCPDPDFQCIEFKENGVSTRDGVISAEIEGFSLPQGRYRAVVLQTVLAHATHADFSKYPIAIPFVTDTKLTGVFVGVRQ